MPTVRLHRNKGHQFFDNNDNELNGGTLEYDDAGTSNDQIVYSDSDGTSSLGSTVTLDSNGRLTTSIYVNTTGFKETLKDSSGNTIFTEDNIPGAEEIAAANFSKSQSIWNTITSSTSIPSGNAGEGYFCNTTSNDITVTLPQADVVGTGKDYTLFKTSGVNVLTIQTVLSQAITGLFVNGPTYKIFANGGMIQIRSNGASWFVVTDNRVGYPGQLIPTAEVIAPTGTVFTYGQTLSRTIYDEVFDNITLQVTGNTTNAGNQLTSISGLTEAIGAGCLIEGNGIPTGTTISSISGTTITMSANATATQAAVDVRLLPWGRGDGSTTFNAPNTRSYALIGRSNMGGDL
ncbi:MAG: hypothetical protein AAF228_13350 [Pseudomonadota bacterium]